MEILRFTDLLDKPWKNGGGITREIAMGRTTDHIVWRMSRADVAKDGAFSDFAGLVRILTVVSNNSMGLEHAGGTIDVERWNPVRFDGGLKVSSCLKDGPLTDLNLMFDPEYCDGQVCTRRGPDEQTLETFTQDVLALHVLSGNPIVDGVRLAFGDTAFIDGTNAALSLSEDDTVLEIMLTYIVQSESIKLCIAKR